ncbi:DUF2163 domain-containing protein [Tranquillimonas alkanivorans]|uniref:Bacteriophage phiJL001 Gp84 C-terminal domain-containing protein n=1 Tax=Tranquillimonas alkanivorans TaxID=441119 RepID=A0A1I5QRW2_9RHOB|nr:DUF2163 domain-containing protein [Tranquillimonas alkanivorans]SFP48771.1 phage conserved hypothetical protein BR0599 [Tranquillimonas alkanivorans]
MSGGLRAHLESGTTTLCRCWRVMRRDGVAFGFTDHDVALAFDGMEFRPSDGLSARALEETTGLAVNNTEALGVLSDDAIREADVLAGRFDGAEVLAWLVNWAAPEERVLRFRGTLGEIRRVGASFRAELRGLTEALNQPRGRVFQGDCPAVLGDGACRVDLSAPGYSVEAEVRGVEGVSLRFDPLSGYADRWFEKGRLRVLSGAAEGLEEVVKNDRLEGSGRKVELWDALKAEVAVGDRVRLEAGCDKRAETCRLKFDNFLNFRGFPHLPGEDWLMAYPTRAGVNDGGRLS